MFFPTWDHLYEFFNSGSVLMEHGLFNDENHEFLPENCRSDFLFQDTMFQDPIFREMRRKYRKKG